MYIRLKLKDFFPEKCCSTWSLGWWYHDPWLNITWGLTYPTAYCKIMFIHILIRPAPQQKNKMIVVALRLVRYWYCGFPGIWRENQLIWRTPPIFHSIKHKTTGWCEERRVSEPSMMYQGCVWGIELSWAMKRKRAPGCSGRCCRGMKYNLTLGPQVYPWEKWHEGFLLRRNRGYKL